MKISYNWIKEFINLKASPQKLAEDLSLIGHEVEKIDEVGDDHILNFAITANRGDLLSIYGMAREVAALYKLKIKSEKLNTKIKSEKLNKNVTVNIDNMEICPSYTTRIIDNIKIGDSPKWIKKRLKSYGFRSINNIVDITNYVMIETGQPLHAFDYDKIFGDTIKVRLSKSNESLTTLDGKKRILDDNSIVISDEQKIYGLAGIMGGFNSEINNNTKTIILEAAIFNPISIRQASKRLGIITDASYRYEHGVDTERAIPGLNRAAELILRECPLARIGEIHQNKSPIKDRKIKIDTQKISSLLGINFNKKTVLNYLERLGFINITEDYVVVPSYRIYDVKIWQDLAEEVARIYGYNKIAHAKISKTISKPNNEFIKKECIKDVLANNGFCEVYSYSFSDEKLLQLLKVNFNNCLQVSNSIAPELQYLRNDLVASILTAIAKNPWAPEIKIFEMGKVFYNNSEKEQLIIAVTGKLNYELDNLNRILNLRAGVKSISQNVSDYLKIRRPIKYILSNLENISFNSKRYLDKFLPKKYIRISEFPPTIRDVAFITKINVNPEFIKKEIINCDSHILIVELFDEFVSNKFGKGNKSTAYHIWIQNLAHPMEDTEINKIIAKIIDHISKKFKAHLR